MSDYQAVADAFTQMAHRIVWCSAATVGVDGTPRTRILHPIWEWAGDELVGWIATGRTPVKADALAVNPTMSLSYWTTSHDTCSADCRVRWADDDVTRHRTWHLFANAPSPVGYDPRHIPGWDSPDVDRFAVLRLTPYRLRVFPGTVLLGQGGEVLRWTES